MLVRKRKDAIYGNSMNMMDTKYYNNDGTQVPVQTNQQIHYYGNEETI